MGTMIAFYVRATEDSVVADVCARFPVAKVEPGNSFVGFLLSDHNSPREALAQLSADLGTDVIWLSFQSVVDAFEFHHWHSGQALRSLIYGCQEQGIWECVEGQTEPWEREAYFRPYSPKLIIPDDQRRERERICREAVLLAGLFEPYIDARESARKVAEFYHFPGWD
jgi:hypothetical protein